MTQSPLEKLIVLAVASGMTAAEFRNAVNALQTASPHELEEFFKQVRNRLRHLDDRFSAMERGFEQGSLARRDVLTLVRSAGVPPRLAAERIAAQLQAEDASRTFPAFSQKEGLGRWIDRVSRSVGESALLNAAVGAFSHGSQNAGAWTLSRS